MRAGNPSFNPDMTLDSVLTLDEVGLSALHTHFYPQVYQFAYYRLHDSGLAEAVSQGVFIELLKEAAAGTDSLRHLSGWLMSCAARLVNDQLLPGTLLYEGEGVTSYQAPQEQMVIDDQAQSTSLEQFLAAARRQSRKRRVPQLKWPRGLSSLLIAIGLLAAAASLVASYWALPGNRLYPVKLAVEQTRLWLPGSASQRLAAETAFDRRRLEEVEELRQTGAGAVEVEIAGSFSQLSPDQWLVEGIPIVILSETQFKGQIEPGMIVRLVGELQPQGFILARSVMPREYRLTGRLQRIQDGLWVVDGLPIQIPPQATLQGQPQVGSQLRLMIHRMVNGGLLARWVEVTGK
jgi:DNA-directed RNA polymerase specialized sigma24 family protein